MKAGSPTESAVGIEGSQHDGLTTNGVLILNPDEKGSYARSSWREVSICGYIYEVRDGKNRSVVKKVSRFTKLF